MKAGGQLKQAEAEAIWDASNTVEPSKTSASVKSAKGNMKQVVGGLMGNDELTAEGLREHSQAGAEYESARVREYAEGAGEELKGKFKVAVGEKLADQQLMAEGKAEQLKGKSRMRANSN
ncbi:hypothetical protein K493DRAFT_210377 [Basidiobolus meristosporus CBS 931.73]|uniref:CsbD-like domain-containing protein n=1 Tax=Basidiobolus meristosporus CBS 931.73 TaxID=1314790 RepID=A0A1Y1YT68_9FUNG|nr:hypothetical protein K493DRAFT_210377 [Basidiobolus meristosporus CBS 931.73]|eukprot:ORY00937.1 hypothetical protein K493DRAFT_210377 [Basidiobolus meristosporus CBS 931.73]